MKHKKTFLQGYTLDSIAFQQKMKEDSRMVRYLRHFVIICHIRLSPGDDKGYGIFCNHLNLLNFHNKRSKDEISC